MHEFSSTLGWKNKAGQYNVAPYSPGESEIRINFLKSGRRKTYDEQQNTIDDRSKIIFVGGSFTQGWAISDNETYPWKVQKAFPEFEVLNYGTGGYGTYQSLLTLEQSMPALHKPKIVFYGFMAGHEKRNVAPAHWLRHLSKYSVRSHVFLPYATIDKENLLIRHRPEAYTKFPHRDKLAIVALAEKTLNKVKRYGRENQKRSVTEKILLQMQTLSRVSSESITL
jgi:hypothetical protein